jgi:hypothetical protein
LQKTLTTQLVRQLLPLIAERLSSRKSLPIKHRPSLTPPSRELLKQVLRSLSLRWILNISKKWPNLPKLMKKEMPLKHKQAPLKLKSPRLQRPVLPPKQKLQDKKKQTTTLKSLLPLLRKLLPRRMPPMPLSMILWMLKLNSTQIKTQDGSN